MYNTVFGQFSPVFNYPSLDAGKIRVIMRRLPLGYFILRQILVSVFMVKIAAFEEGNGIFTISKCFQMIKQILCLDFLHKIHKIQLQIVKNHQALIQKVPLTLL
jgi:hypothetical protein